MKKQIKTITQYVLTDNEKNLIKDCLDYIIHRKEKHCKPCNISLQAVKDLRRLM